MIIADQKTQRTVWLMSDLADDPQDIAKVARVARQYIASNIALDLIALNPSQQNLRFFRGLLGPRSRVVIAGTSHRAHVSGRPGVPLQLEIAVALSALALGAIEYWSRPLRWGPTAVR